MGFHARLVSTIALATSLAALVGMIALVAYLGHGESGSYIDTLSRFRLTDERMGTALLFVGLLLVAVTGVMTWFIVLYGSFRIAGPMFRFMSNLDTAIKRGPVRPVPIRRDDCLQEEWRTFADASERLRLHYSAISDALDRAERRLETCDGVDAECRAELKKQITEIRTLDRNVKL